MCVVTYWSRWTQWKGHKAFAPRESALRQWHQWTSRRCQRSERFQRMPNGCQRHVVVFSVVVVDFMHRCQLWHWSRQIVELIALGKQTLALAQQKRQYQQQRQFQRQPNFKHFRIAHYSRTESKDCALILSLAFPNDWLDSDAKLLIQLDCKLVGRGSDPILACPLKLICSLNKTWPLRPELPGHVECHLRSTALGQLFSLKSSSIWEIGFAACCSLLCCCWSHCWP